MLPLQAVTSQKGYSVPGNHYQTLMILSKLERAAWWGPGGGTTAAGASSARDASPASLAGRLELWDGAVALQSVLWSRSGTCVWVCCWVPVSHASERGPGSLCRGRAGTLCLCLHRRHPARGHRPHHVLPWVCPSRGDAWRVQRRWTLSQQLAEGTSSALPRPASAAGALLPGTAPCGQTNGLAVDQRGAGCGRPGT